MSYGAARLPGDDVVGREDQVEQLGVGQIGADAADPHGPRQLDDRAALEENRRQLITGADVLLHHRAGERGVRALEEMEHGGHENTRTRRPRPTSPAISSPVTRTTGWPSGFQLGSLGTASASTWKGTPSDLRLARNRAVSSPSTSSSVSSARSSTAGPRSTKTTSFSPATMPSPMRMASLARCETRGSSEIRTTTGRLSATGSVERDEAVRAVDEVRQDDQAAVRERVGVAQRDATLLAAVGAHQALRGARRQPMNARIVQRADAVVDKVKAQLHGARPRGRGADHCRA